MSRRKTDEAARRQQAQELAYKAMSARNPKEALRLCMEAIEIDPHCVDALTTAAGMHAPKERIAILTDVVRIAEDELGGESYFEENKGYFWGLLETRSYMRARSYLAQTLQEAGEIQDSIKEYEALLDLNPSDNQGLRYVLMGLYLETDDLDGVHGLFEEFGSEGSSMFAWSAVLERIISNDTESAERLVSGARKANPYVEDYLLGRRPMPADMPNYYGVGDENEAIMCMDTIGPAWKKHPEAIRWLRRHDSLAQVPSKVKVGRNEPCPCGSGKKYKKCCLGREEPLTQPVGNPYAAEMALNDIRQAMEDREFSSVEEMDSFIQEYNQRKNREPIVDFDGLSSEQMHRLTRFPFDSPDVVEFPSVLDLIPAAPIVELFRMLADAIGEKGLKPTVKGNLPLKVVREMALNYLGEEGYADFIKYGDIRSEEEYYDLHVTRIVAELAGLIRKYKGKFILSRECRKLLKDDDMGAVYPMLLRAFAVKFNWGYSDRYPEVDLIQNFFAYTLYQLTHHGEDWQENAFYEDAFLQAFSSILDSVKSTSYETQEVIVRGMYSQRTLEKFARLLGLVEIAKNAEALHGRGFKLKATPLLRDAVRFHIRD